MNADREKKESELREELEFHLEAEAEERAAAGLSADEAKYAALRSLGNIAMVMEDTRGAWGWTFADNMRQDVRFAARWLRQNAVFSVLAVLILGLGFGATTAVFTVVNAVLLKPLSYNDADRIAVLATFWKKSGARGPVSVPDFRDWHRQSSSFDGMAYFVSGEAAVTVDSSGEFGNFAAVTDEFFKVFALDPAAGRFFNPEEVGPGRPGAIVVSQSFVQNHYASASEALRSTIRLGSRVLPIVGILPQGFHFPGRTDVWFPANTFAPESTQRSGHNVQVVAKLKKDFTVEQAQAEMTTIADRLEQQYPKSNIDKNVAVSRLHDNMVRDARLMLYLLLGASGLVLLVACGNVANLLLAKASARSREIGVRVALGAGRKRIVQQLFTESLLLAIIAGVAGVVIANAGSRALIALASRNVPRLAETAVDGWVLAFAFAVSLFSCLLFGVAPALAAANADVNDSLKQGGTRNVVGGRRSRLRRSLVIAEIALSVVLLVGATLLIRSFAALQNVALGFETESVLIMESSMPGTNDVEVARKATGIYKGILADLATIPGVSAVGAVRVPPGTISSSGGYLVDQSDFGQMRIDMPQAIYSVVAPGAFAALGIRLKAGRDFSSADTFEAPFTVIINEELARRSLPGEDPIGHTIITGFDSATPKPMTIVGVVADIHQRGPAAEPDAEMYMPYEQHPLPSTSLRIVARTDVPPENLFDTFQRVARGNAPEMPVRFTTMEARLSDNISAPRFRTLLLSIFAVLAVALAVAGIYAVVSFVVNQRISEIGLRMALGAASRDVLAMVLSEGLRMALVGLVLGLAGAFAVTRLFSTLLFKVEPTDTVTYVVAIVLVALVTLSASYLPARRAAQVDPSVALRHE